MKPSQYLAPSRRMVIKYCAPVEHEWLAWLVLRAPGQPRRRILVSTDLRAVGDRFFNLVKYEGLDFHNAKLARHKFKSEITDPDDSAIMTAFRRRWPGGVPHWVPAMFQPSPLWDEFMRRYGEKGGVQ
jgi:hypothetical protein